MASFLASISQIRFVGTDDWLKFIALVIELGRRGRGLVGVNGVEGGGEGLGVDGAAFDEKFAREAGKRGTRNREVEAMKAAFEQ